MFLLGWPAEITHTVMEAKNGHDYTLPTYSPELNPVELVFNFIRNFLKHQSIFDNLLEKINEAILQLRKGHIISFYDKCKYWN